MIHSKEIRPQAGFGDLEFNSSIDYTVQKLGQPDHIEVLETMDDESSMAYIFDNQNLIAFFEGSDSLLLTILETKDPQVTLYGKKIFEMDESAIRKLMKLNGFEELDTEMLTWGGQRLSFEDANMDFYFEDDKLTAINWGYHF
jgi:hypothetical protein